ncbi:nuclear transport factor 2 family protein [Lutimonas sp.]|uniref:nuclear transport factor 2 family protein n=1 Tax=Lutimonas sp. TaxID=1872403 RepID=UPI003C745F63
MKKSLFILAMLLTMMSCSEQNKHADENVALIEKYVQAVQNLEYTTMESMLDDGYMGYGPSSNDSINKALAVSNWKANVEDLYESISYSKSRNLAQFVPDGENAGEWVSNWAELSITYKKDGKKVTLMTNTIYKIEKGKIVKSYTFYNEADVLEQLGYVFINPEDL